MILDPLRPLRLAMAVLLTIGISARSVLGDRSATAMTSGPHHQPSANRTGEIWLAHDGRRDAHATGTVNTVDPARHTLNISHNPIPEIGWPAMTMDFAVAPTVDLHSIKPGNRVDFTMEQGAVGMYVIQSIAPAGTRQR